MSRVTPDRQSSRARRLARRLGCILLAQVCAPGAASGSPATATGSVEPYVAVTLTWEDARHRAEVASGLVRRARAERQIVLARRVGADLLFPSNPVVALQGGLRREDTGGTRVEGRPLAGHLEQTLEVAGQRSARRAQVDREVESADWRERVALTEVQARTRASYVGVLLAETQVQAAARRVALVGRLLEGIRARVESGAASTVDLELALIEDGQARREHLTAGLSLATAETELRTLVGLPPGTPLVLGTPLGSPAGWTAGMPGTASSVGTGNDARVRLGELLGRARDARAELRALASTGAALDAELVRLTREAAPNPTLFIDAGRDLPGQIFIGAGVAVPLPLWRRNQGERATNRAQRQQISEETSVTEREIDAEVERTFLTVLTERDIVENWQRVVLPAVESAVELTTEGWRAGKFDLFRVIQASREASEARRGHLQSLGALWQASIALERAVGQPPDPSDQPIPPLPPIQQMNNRNFERPVPSVTPTP